MFPNPKRPVDGIFVLELARFINKLCPVSVFSPIPYFPCLYKTKKYKDFGSIARTAVFSDMKVYYYRYFMVPKYLKWLDGFSYACSMGLVAKEVLKKSSVLIAHWTYPDAFAGLVWGRILKKKIVLVVHGNESIQYYDPPSLKKILIKLTLANVDHIIAVSNDLKRKIVTTHNVPESRITVLPNGVDFNKFPFMTRYEARKQLGLPLGNKILLTVARLSPEKALHTMIEAFSCIEEKKDISLYILGDGPEKIHLENLVRQKGMERQISLVGSVPHGMIHLWMNSADIFLLSSLREGSPVVIGEAFACGTPVVASSVGGVPDLIVNDRLGMLFEPNSSLAMHRSLETALLREWDRDYIREYGLKLGWNNIADRILKLIYNNFM